MTHKRIFASIALMSLIVLTGAGCGGASTADQAATQKVELQVWNVFDNEDAFKDIMNNYRTLHPNVSFEYRTLRPEEYEQALIEGFASGTGPDIYAVHNTWLGKYRSLNLITPLPDSLTIPYSEVRGTIKKETVTVLKEEPTLTIRSLKADFVDAVAMDTILPYQPNPKLAPIDRIWGLPLSVDTLALFYNKDLLNAAGIAEPPTTWTRFQADVTKLTSIGAGDEIIQSGAALGTSRNVERAFDIVSLLMMQNGVTMVNDRGRAAFGEMNANRVIPGADAVRFYTDFASPLKAVYTWNTAQPSSFDAFAAGKTAYFFGYSYHIPLIRAQAAKLNFGIAPAPQIEDGKVVNQANYWLFTTSKGTAHVDWAWDFIQFASKPEQVSLYLESAGKPTARRALIAEQLANEDLNPFVGQLLTAQSWYRGTNALVAEQAFLELIDAGVAGLDVEAAIKQSQNKVNTTL